MVERPAPAPSAGAATPEDFPKQPLAGITPEKHVLARCMTVAVARRNGDPFDAKRHRGIEERGGLVRVGTVEQRAVDGDAKRALACQAYRGHRLVEHALLANRLVVSVLIAVEVDR